MASGISMMRGAFLLSGLFVAACSVGEIPAAGAGGGSDAGSGSDAAGSGSGSDCVDRLAIPETAHDHGGGVTNAGQNCIVAGCHGPGGAGPPYQFAGTVYKPGTTTPSTGATVQIKNAAGTTVMTNTDSAGNFSIVADTLANPFPASTVVSACPTHSAMVGQVVTGGGGCNNATGCHGASMPITLADQ